MAITNALLESISKKKYIKNINVKSNFAWQDLLKTGCFYLIVLTSCKYKLSLNNLFYLPGINLNNPALINLKVSYNYILNYNNYNII